MLCPIHVLQAQTRYVVFSKGKADPLGLQSQSQTKKTSITVALKNTSGSFFKMVSCFALRVKPSSLLCFDMTAHSTPTNHHSANASPVTQHCPSNLLRGLLLH